MLLKKYCGEKIAVLITEKRKKISYFIVDETKILTFIPSGTRSAFS
jgi:hypothetical protein